jgi:benzoyl-CoA reductase subunit C
MSMFEQFKQWYEQRHEYARDWKARTGGKVVGCFCTYEPEEILYAADILPVRAYGSHQPSSVTEPHIFGMFCPWTRDVLAQGLQGKYDYLDGITTSQSCLHFRQCFTSWEKHVPSEFSYYLPMPHGVQTKGGLEYFTQELRRFKEALEEWTGSEITNESLREGIEVMNENRRLLTQLYELRQAENPPLTGKEALWIVASAQMTDKREHSRALKELLEELPNRGLNRDPGTRLMLVGSENDDVEFIEMSEALGSTFVVDENCVGTRYFWGEVKLDRFDDPLEAIAARYLERPACPAKDWPQLTRWVHIERLARDWKVQGAILMQQKFCDPHELDIPTIKRRLEEMGVRTLFLEFDVTMPSGQFRTRVEAFLEMMRDEELFAEELF